MKIVVLDGYALNPNDLSWKGLEELGEVTIYDRTNSKDEDEIVERIGDAPLVLTNKTPITEAILSRCPSVKYVGVLATGYNVIDLEATKKRGIIVTNTPAYGTDAVAQFTIALLLEMCCHVGHHNEAVHEGAWGRSKDFCFWDMPLMTLAGKTFGVIGYGRIGEATAKIANALGMRVLAVVSHKRENPSPYCEYVDLDTLFAQSDVISLHCPLFEVTQGIICKENIAKMKDGVILLNTSRGGLVVDEDLAEALSSGKVKAAGLDVISTEPVPDDNPLLKAPNCFITPHIAWASKEARECLLGIAVNNLKSYLEGKPVNTVS